MTLKGYLIVFMVAVKLNLSIDSRLFPKNRDRASYLNMRK